MPVLTFLRVTVAPGTTAPVVSRTVPSTLAVSNWATATAGTRVNMQKNERIHVRAWNERNCSAMPPPRVEPGKYTPGVLPAHDVRRRRLLEEPLEKRDDFLPSLGRL